MDRTNATKRSLIEVVICLGLIAGGWPSSALAEDEASSIAVSESATDAGVDIPDVADLTVPIATKRTLLLTLSGAALDSALARVLPLEARSTLCAESLGRAAVALMRVESVDANGDRVSARVRVDGAEAGEAPSVLRVGLCAQSVQLTKLDDGRTQTVGLTAAKKETVHVDWGGTPTRWSLSPLLDVTVFDPPTRLVPPGNPPALGVLGTGLRLDRWSTLFHGSIALTVNPLFGPLLNLPVVPNVDIFGGINFRPGNKTVRAVMSAQLGLWQLVHPAAGATIGMMLFERFLITATADARLFLIPVVVPSLAQFFPSPLALGLTTTAGVCW